MSASKRKSLCFNEIKSTATFIQISDLFIFYFESVHKMVCFSVLKNITNNNIHFTEKREKTVYLNANKKPPIFRRNYAIITNFLLF